MTRFPAALAALALAAGLAAACPPAGTRLLLATDPCPADPPADPAPLKAAPLKADPPAVLREVQREYAPAHREVLREVVRPAPVVIRERVEYRAPAERIIVREEAPRHHPAPVRERIIFREAAAPPVRERVFFRAAAGPRLLPSPAAFRLDLRTGAASGLRLRVAGRR